MNKYVADDGDAIPTLKIDHGARAGGRSGAIREVRRKRDAAKAEAALAAIRAAAQTEATLDLWRQPDGGGARGGAAATRTLGEICRIFREVFGEYRDPAEV